MDTYRFGRRIQRVRSLMAALLFVGVMIPLLGFSQTAQRLGFTVWNQSEADIYGDYIVYQYVSESETMGGIYVVLHDLISGTSDEIAFPGATPNVCISGQKVVWQGKRSLYEFERDLFIYDIETGQTTQFAVGTEHDVYPAISDDRIVYQYQHGSLDSELAIYDLRDGSGYGITFDDADQMYPAISGETIVWQDNRNGNWDIYMYDVNTEQITPLIVNSGDQINPAIDGDKVVWQDNRNGNWDIYVHDISTGETLCLCNDSADQVYPDISGQRVVWQDNRNGNSDIFGYDLTDNMEEVIESESHSQSLPAIYGGNIVWQDNRYDGTGFSPYSSYYYGTDIFLLETPFPESSGLIDDYEGNGDLELQGRYYAFGETVLQQDASRVSTERALSGMASRFIAQSNGGGQWWGCGVMKDFTAGPVDVSAYGTLDIWLNSPDNDAIRTFDVNLVFAQDGGGSAVYSLKGALELSLADVYNQWTKLSISLDVSNFDVEVAGEFDLAQLDRIELFIRNNGQGNAASRKVYFDDVSFVQPPSGLVDDYEGNGDPALAGTYFAFGEVNLLQGASGETTDQAASPIHSRYLQHSAYGGQWWGNGVLREFNAGTVDISGYDVLSIALRSADNDAYRTFDVNLVFAQAGGGEAIYSLKSALEPALASAYNEWETLFIPLRQSQFDAEVSGAFDLTQLKRIEFFIRHNQHGNNVDRLIFFDDVEFIQVDGGLVDDYEGNGDPQLAGSYMSFGDINLGPNATDVTDEESLSPTHSRYFEHTIGGGRSYGVGLLRDFSSGLIDVSEYEALEVAFRSSADDALRTFDVNLVFANGIYSYKQALEPTLASAYGQWQTLTIQLDPSLFDIESGGTFDLTQLARIEFFIRNNGQGNGVYRKVYIDDVRFKLPPEGLVDDFQSEGDPALAGSYIAFGEVNLNGYATGCSSRQYHSPGLSRYLMHSVNGGQSWGNGVLRNFQAGTVDVSEYDMLEVFAYSEDSDAVRTFDVSMVFDQVGGGEAIYSLKHEYEPTLTSMYQQWFGLSIPLIQSRFDMEVAGAFDLTRLKRIEFFIRHNGQGNGVRRVIYMDDVRFYSTD